MPFSLFDLRDMLNVSIFTLGNSWCVKMKSMMVENVSNKDNRTISYEEIKVEFEYAKFDLWIQ